MGIEIGKSLKIALVPSVILIVLGLFQLLVGYIPFVGGFAALCTGIPLILVSAVVLGWAGYEAAKNGMDVVGGALTGGIAGLLSSIVVGVIGMILAMLGIGVGVATGGDVGTAALGAGFGIVAGLIAIALGVGFWLVTGLVMGAIGALIVGTKK